MKLTLFCFVGAAAAAQLHDEQDTLDLLEQFLDEPEALAGEDNLDEGLSSIGESRRRRRHRHGPHGHNPHVHTPYPTPHPTAVPTTYPTPSPTVSPTNYPTPQPTSQPTAQPTALPTPQPTAQPTPSPTTNPTMRYVGVNTYIGPDGGEYLGDCSTNWDMKECPTAGFDVVVDAKKISYKINAENDLSDGNNIRIVGQGATVRIIDGTFSLGGKPTPTHIMNHINSISNTVTSGITVSGMSLLALEDSRPIQHALCAGYADSINRRAADVTILKMGLALTAPPAQRRLLAEGSVDITFSTVSDSDAESATIVKQIAAVTRATFAAAVAAAVAAEPSSPMLTKFLGSWRVEKLTPAVAGLVSKLTFGDARRSKNIAQIGLVAGKSDLVFKSSGIKSVMGGGGCLVRTNFCGDNALSKFWCDTNVHATLSSKVTLAGPVGSNIPHSFIKYFTDGSMKFEVGTGECVHVMKHQGRNVNGKCVAKLNFNNKAEICMTSTGAVQIRAGGDIHFT